MENEEKWADPLTVRCLICDTTGKWKSVDEFQVRKTGMSMCECCGFVTHMSNLKSKAELVEYYRKDYRNPPTGKNFYSGERKLHYHRKFLDPLLKEWAKEKGKDKVIFESGAAFGLFLHWLKVNLPEAEVSGSELTQTYRRVCQHDFGITLDEDIDTSKKYDLICSYKVAEHMIDADKELRTFVECLKEGGHIYISVPIWFKALSNFGAAGWDINYYYHTNHINVWSENLFEGLLKKVGLKVIKSDDKIYDNTYLCVRDDSLMNEPRTYDDPAKRLEQLKTIYSVHELLIHGDFLNATLLWKDFPVGYANLLERQRAAHNKFIEENGFEAFEEKFLKHVVESCNESPDALIIASDWCMRYSMWEKAIRYLDRAYELRIGMPSALMNRAHCFAKLAMMIEGPSFDQTKTITTEQGVKLVAEAIGTLKELKKLSAESFEEATTWIYRYESMIPLRRVK